MPTNDTLIQPAIPDQHFADIARLLNTQEMEPNTAESLAEWYGKQQADGIRFFVAVSPNAKVLGFSGIYRAFTNLERNYSLYLIVKPGIPPMWDWQPALRPPADPGIRNGCPHLASQGAR